MFKSTKDYARWLGIPSRDTIVFIQSSRKHGLKYKQEHLLDVYGTLFQNMRD